MTKWRFVAVVSVTIVYSYGHQYLWKDAFLLPENYIDGNEFTKLTEGEVKDMVPPIGLAKKIIRMIPKVLDPAGVNIVLPVCISYSFIIGP